ncbi:MAG: hypothetical protein QGG64_19080 [Candidatus Latescibacteria bacterium]|nr:hypothetical protein [Candidatus Latescibacterota bacterium]
MEQMILNLPWGLTIEGVQKLIDVDSAISIVEPARPFGGLNGEKALVKVEDGSERQVLLKKVEMALAQREVHAYSVLVSVDAPVVVCYGLEALSNDEAVVAIEYLPYAIDWPILPERHLKWAAAVAELARCPMPKVGVLPQIHFLSEYDDILSGIESVVGDSNPDLCSALVDVNSKNVLSLVRDVLADFLAEVDRLPQGLTHGECYPMHMGQRKLDEPLLFFDVPSTGVRPRFFDVQGLVVDHGEPYEIGDTTLVLRRFWEVYYGDVSWDAFVKEVKMMEGLVALRNIGCQWQLWQEARGEAWQNAEEAMVGHFKWIRLGMIKVDEVLTEWEGRVSC